MPPSPARGLTIGASTFLDDANAVTPPDPFRRHFHPIPDAALLTPSPFRRNYNNNNSSNHSIRQSPVETTRGGEEDESKEFLDPLFSSDMDTSLLEMDCYWNDPMLTTIMLKPSLDLPSAYASDAPTTTATVLRSLEGVQDSIRKSILATDHAQQPALVSLVAAWARRVAKDPLQSPATLPAFPWQPARHQKGNTRDDNNNSNNNGHDDGDDETVDARNGLTAAV
jgi:hypothetical protein